MKKNRLDNNLFYSALKRIKPYKYLFIKIIIFYTSVSFLVNNYYQRYDNNINLMYYEKNIDFSNYSTDIKALAIYLPNLYFINKTYFGFNRDYNTLTILQNFARRYKQRILDNNYINNYNLKTIIRKQIKLAKSHGIYGFAIYYYWFSGITIFEKPLNIFYKNKMNFHYLLIWKNEKIMNKNNEIILEEKYEKNDSEKFIKDIKKYLIDKLYIRRKEKPIIGIYNIKAIPNLRYTIFQLFNRY